MSLTNTQQATLKAYIEANPSLNSKPNTSDGNFEIATILNQLATPVFYVWKTSVVVSELMGAGFDWTRVDNLTVGKARIWDFMTAVGVVDPSQPNVRAGFEACYSVEAGDQPCRQAIYNGSSRTASDAEKLFATGTGTAPTHHGVGPATMGWEGQLSYTDVGEARNS